MQLDKKREERLLREEQRQIKKKEEERARKESVPGQLRYFAKMVEHLLPKMGDNPAEYTAYFESVEDIFRPSRFQKHSSKIGSTEIE